MRPCARRTTACTPSRQVSTSLDTGFQLARQLVARAVVVNETSDYRIDAMPFGGFKSSGIGREGVRFAVEAMTEPKNVIVNLGC